MQYVFLSVQQRICFCLHALQDHVLRWSKPPSTSLAFSTLADLTRGKAELLAENALLRQQLNILRRQVKRPVYRKRDRLLLVLLARLVRTWKQALILVQPETDLALARELFRMFPEAQIKDTCEPAEALARDNQLDPAKWRQTTDRKFGPSFAQVATTSGIKVLRTPYRTPQANAVCERFLGSVRRECLNHFFIFQEKQLHRLLNAYILYFNQARPHQGLGQRIPDQPVFSPPPANKPNKVRAVPVLGGLHHDYQRAV